MARISKRYVRWDETHRHAVYGGWDTLGVNHLDGYQLAPSSGGRSPPPAAQRLYQPNTGGDQRRRKRDMTDEDRAEIQALVEYGFMTVAEAARLEARLLADAR